MNSRSRIAAGVLILIALVRIAATFRVLSETTDEALHVAVGLHLFTQHRYGMQFENPPLVPLVLAAPLMLAGVKTPGDGAYVEMLHSVFYSLPSYKTSLFLARVGTLLFFAIAALAMWAWTRRELGDRVATIALLLFTMEPILLGYSGLATHDAAAMAGVAVSMLALSRWLEQRSWRRAIEMGGALGFATLCKFSCIPFVGVAWLAVLALRFARERRAHGVMRLTVVPLVAAFVVWAGYGFSVGSVPWIAGGATVPAPALFRGIVGLLAINSKGMVAYALGRTSETGWWWYFPLAILVKTTLPLLALMLAGFVRSRAAALEAAVAGAAILAVGMSANLHLGIRYVLPVYVCWMLPAAAFAASLKRRWVVAALLALQIGSSVAAHPDYFPYFNALAARDPSRYLIDSNLDWGQDVLRLRSVIRREKITSLGMIVFGTADLDALGFPKRFELHPQHPTAGWVAISEHAYRMSAPGWLRGRPYRRIGTSIRLYYVP